MSQVAAQYFIPNEYDKLMAAIGAEGTNAFTSNDVTCYTEDIPSNEIENWAKIQSDRFQNMVIRGFHTELEAVYEEYNIYLTYDNDKVMSALGKKLTPTHPYGTQTTIGTQEHLKNPSIVNIENYFKKWYVPNNIAICVWLVTSIPTRPSPSSISILVVGNPPRRAFHNQRSRCRSL